MMIRNDMTMKIFMKKIGKKIILFFDKWLITPITKLILLITDFVKDHGREIEKFINKTPFGMMKIPLTRI